MARGIFKPRRRFNRQYLVLGLLIIGFLVASKFGGNLSLAANDGSKDQAAKPIDTNTSTTTASPTTSSTVTDPETSTTETSEISETTTTTAALPPQLPLVPTTVLPPDSGIDPPPALPWPQGPPGGNSVFVLGDSVFLGTTRTIPEALPDWLVSYDAVGSRRLSQSIEHLAEVRGHIGEAVVIHLGNNYIVGERGDFGSQMDEAMAVLADVPRVIWVTVAEVSPTRVAINESIREVATRWPNAHVLDWAPVVGADPGYTWDGIHLTNPGRRAMGEAVAAALGPVKR